MRSLRSILLCAVALPAAGLATPAAACVFLPITCIGSDYDCKPSRAQRLAEEKRWSANQTRARLAEARKRLRAGEVDFAAELAELLVPNVRPVRAEYSSCGPMGELDHGEGRETEEGLFAALTAGTRFAGSDYERFRTVIHRAEEDLSIGRSCNAEFRLSFAEFLRQSLAPAELREAWIFLGARQRSHNHYGSIYHRLVSFEGTRRRPPLQWVAADRWLRDQVMTALRRTAWGRSLETAQDAFWAKRASELDDLSRVCPAELARWTTARERVLALMVEQEGGPPTDAGRKP